MIALNRSDNLAADLEIHSWTLDNIMLVMAKTWTKPQVDPSLPPCENKKCSSGLPAKVCPCKNNSATATPDPRCAKHMQLSTEQLAYVKQQLSGLSRKNDSDGKSPNFKACLRMSICNRCLGKFNTEKFDEFWQKK